MCIMADVWFSSPQCGFTYSTSPLHVDEVEAFQESSCPCSKKLVAQLDAVTGPIRAAKMKRDVEEEVANFRCVRIGYQVTTELSHFAAAVDSDVSKEEVPSNLSSRSADPDPQRSLQHEQLNEISRAVMTNRQQFFSGSKP